MTTIYSPLEQHAWFRFKKELGAYTRFHFSTTLDHSRFDHIVLDFHFDKKGDAMISTFRHMDPEQNQCFYQLNTFYPVEEITKGFEQLPVSVQALILLAKHCSEKRNRIRQLFTEGEEQ